MFVAASKIEGDEHDSYLHIETDLRERIQYLIFDFAPEVSRENLCPLLNEFVQHLTDPMGLRSMLGAPTSPAAQTLSGTLSQVSMRSARVLRDHWTAAPAHHLDTVAAVTGSALFWFQFIGACETGR